MAESHPAIIDPEEWQKVQYEMRRRKSNSRRHNCTSPFSAKLVCGDCGEHYGSKVWHSSSKYRRTIWQCNGKFKGDRKCCTPHLYEQDLKEYFATALSTLLSCREVLLEDGRAIKKELSDCSGIEAQLDENSRELEIVSALIKKLIEENASQALDQNSFGKPWLWTLHKILRATSHRIVLFLLFSPAPFSKNFMRDASAMRHSPIPSRVTKRQINLRLF